MATTITRKTAKKIVAPVAVVAAALENVKAPEAAPAPVVSTWTRWPRAEDFGGEPLNLPKYFGPVAPRNSAGVALSWTNAATREARQTRHSVTVRCGEFNETYKSVKEAFRALRLPLERHIKFRLSLKTSETGRATFTGPDGKVYAFELVTE